MAMYWTAGTSDITVLHARLRFAPADADWLWLGVLRFVRGEDADVAGAHLVARRACRGADRRIGHPGRHSPEDGRLRLHPLLAADVSRRLASISRRSSSLCRSSPSSTPRWSRWRRRSMKKLIAYSSVAHMGFVTMGIFCGQHSGNTGRGVYQMISHGLVSGALFLCVGVALRPACTLTTSSRLRRSRAAACRVYAVALHGVYFRQYRVAGHDGLRRRVPHPLRRLSRPTTGSRFLATIGVDPVGVLTRSIFTAASSSALSRNRNS